MRTTRPGQNVLSSKVTVINAVSDPLKVLKVLVEGLALHDDSALWLTPLRTLPTVPRISPYSLVFLGSQTARWSRRWNSRPPRRFHDAMSRQKASLVLPESIPSMHPRPPPATAS